MASEGYTIAPERQETDRLLVGASKQCLSYVSRVVRDDSFDIEAGEQHAFEGGLCQCCGNCDETGWTACVLGYFAPCIPFGLNAQRGLGKSAVKYAVCSFLLMSSAFILYQVGRPFWEPQFRAACVSDEFHQNPTEECKKAFERTLLISVIMFVASLIVVFILALWGAKVRTDLRRKFNIPGTYFGDVCTWFWCSRCAVCQESRTIWANNVRNGVWHGQS